MQMPVMNGIEFLTKVEQGVPDTVRLMLTGNADQKTAMDAVNHGHVFRFLTKPCPPETLTQAIEDAIHQYELVVAERELLENTLNGAVKVLTDVLSAVDPQAFGRGRQVAGYMQVFLRSFTVSQPWELDLAAMLAPVGRVTLPAAVLMKERSALTLTPAEKDMLARVPEVGAELLNQIPRLENVARIVQFQNTRFDRSGWPSGADQTEEYPVGARILKVLCDLADLESKGASKAAALRQMKQADGCYDPAILDIAFSTFEVATHPEAAAKPPVAVRVQELRTGPVLAEDVTTKDGMLVPLGGIGPLAGVRRTPVQLPGARHNSGVRAGVPGPKLWAWLRRPVAKG